MRRREGWKKYIINYCDIYSILFSIITKGAGKRGRERKCIRISERERERERKSLCV
jgi:hypothetical protein